jgi:hypothetical protein
MLIETDRKGASPNGEQTTVSSCKFKVLGFNSKREIRDPKLGSPYGHSFGIAIELAAEFRGWHERQKARTKEWFMSLRSPDENENGGTPHVPTRHSRARGNPGLLPTELAWILAFAGMTQSK